MKTRLLCLAGMGLMPVSLEFERWRQKGEAFKAKIWLYSEFEVSVGYRNLCLNNKKKHKDTGHLLGNLV